MRNILLTVFVIILIGLIYFFPQVMINPGPLSEGHIKLKEKCSSCHSPMRGVVVEKCLECHKPDEIGKDDKGDSTKTIFHKFLSENNCLACHTDHKGLKPANSLQKFQHDLIQSAVRDDCSKCHQAPADNVHSKFENRCVDCHQTDQWKGAHFDHSRLADNVSCTDCHERPSDQLHSQIRGNCKSCHSTDQWKPATFEHDQYFVLDHDHNAECKTCHQQSDYKSYTCYNCHEHSPSKIERKHLKEGISNFQNCVACHKSAEEHEGGEGHEGGEEREGD
ncbi:MAG: cytochrome c3 family protein [Bacteroidia bacterium]